MSELLPAFFLQSGVNKNKKIKMPDMPKDEKVIQKTRRLISCKSISYELIIWYMCQNLSGVVQENIIRAFYKMK